MACILLVDSENVKKVESQWIDLIKKLRKFWVKIRDQIKTKSQRKAPLYTCKKWTVENFGRCCTKVQLTFFGFRFFKTFAKGTFLF